MRSQLLEVEKERFYLNDASQYLVQGVIPEGDEVEAYLDRKKLPCVTTPRVAVSAIQRFKDSEVLEGQRVEALITLPEDLSGYRELRLFSVSKESRRRWFRIGTKELTARRNRPQFFIELEHMDQDTKTLVIRGWAAADGHVRLRFYDDDKKPVSVAIQRNARTDVQDMFAECTVDHEAGFYAEIEGVTGRYLYLVMRPENGKPAVHRIGTGKKEVLFSKVEKYRKKGMTYLRANGPRALAIKAGQKVQEIRNRPMPYEKWLPRHLPDRDELERQRRDVPAFSPKISIVVPLYRTKEEYLRALVDSVRAQTYTNWELILSDGSGADSPLTGILRELEETDSRIRPVLHKERLRIAQNTNAAIEAASGTYIAFADHDDLLCEHALYACVQALNERPDAELIYSDEDKVSVNGKHFFEPQFKPDFNLDLLHTVNYICHLMVVKRELLERTGLLRPEFEGAQDYDLTLRCIENTGAIVHIPQILYHWRSHEESTSENPESKLYAFEAGERALQAHFDRIGVKAEVYRGAYPGLYRTRYIRDHDPLVSILIPNKDHIDDLERCIRSVEEKSTYRNYEYIIIENNSEEEETFAYYKELEKRYPHVHVVYWDGPFNFPDINNFGAEKASGEYLLLLNNDTEVINETWLEELLGYGMRPDVGIVGARLYYEDNTVQHAGVVIGFGGIAGHCFVQQPRENTGYCHRIISAQNYSAVTAACMLVRASVYREVGGMSHDLAVAFNDIDFCLKVREAGYLVVYNPYVELYHYESKSRGYEDTPEKRERFARETATLEAHWPEVFRKPDPYYNVNLTLKSQDFSLKKL
ncbi:MAG: glycosyltransferase family 2 protein [Blautia sp.]|nr:glycosyltransferase family 2 protein [Blautia sp.]